MCLFKKIVINDIFWNNLSILELGIDEIKIISFINWKKTYSKVDHDEAFFWIGLKFDASGWNLNLL